MTLILCIIAAYLIGLTVGYWGTYRRVARRCASIANLHSVYAAREIRYTFHLEDENPEHRRN